ncbi:MAG: hypothetical protein JSS64_06365 [Bacteroidetes bacterium]|nr:hypothetical protein [Bacteroidota bacterium]
MAKSESNKETPKKVDIINDLLEDCLLAFPVSGLLISFYQQYHKRGFLTKKQLEGLYGKASSVATIHPGKLATLAAMIQKMPNRFKSELPEKTIGESKSENEWSLVISKILEKYPEHKRVRFFQMKTEKGDELNSKEVEELKRFEKLLS